MLNKKAQQFSVDVLISVGIFLVILTTLFWSWQLLTEKIIENNEMQDMKISSKNAISNLLETPGVPKNWHKISNTSFDSNNPFSLGLSGTRPMYLSGRKVNRLNELNNSKYEEIKFLIGLQKYDFNIKIFESDNTSYVNLLYDIGLNPDNNSTIIVLTNRYAYLNGSWVKINFRVWK